MLHRVNIALLLVAMTFMLVCTGIARAQTEPLNSAHQLPSRLVILQYHHISDYLARSTSVTFTEFYQHLELIEQLKAQVSDISTALQKIKQQPNGLFFIAISFDDASISLLNQAIPELQRRNWPYTIFVNTEAVEQQHKNTMSWQQIKRLKDQGAIIANHSHSHGHLVQQTHWQADIEKAQQLLQKYIYPNESVPKLFSYPFGEYSPVVADYFRRNQWLAVAQHSGSVGVNTDLVGMPRFAISGHYSNLKSLRTKLLTLPFPAKKSLHPKLYSQHKSSFTVMLDDMLPSEFEAQKINCFHSEGGAIPAKSFATISSPIIKIEDLQPFKFRRGKINCTLAHGVFKQHYYWFSKLFINTNCTESGCPVSLSN